MKRENLEHIIRAAGDLLGENEIIVVGSQAILGAIPDGLPKRTTLSIEVDVMAREDPEGEKAFLINGAIGEMTHFQSTHGYYAEGVGEGVARFPAGWEERLVRVSTDATNGVTGLCAEPYDICVAKLLAGRKKDFEYVGSLIKSGHINPAALLERASLAASNDREKEIIIGFVSKAALPMKKGRKPRQFHQAIDQLRANSAAIDGSTSDLPDVAELDFPPSANSEDVGR